MKTNQNNTRVGKEERAINLFADMMIEKIENLQTDWQKPWFTDGANAWPCNISGREYNGMNTLMLLIHCEKMGYSMPVFITYNRTISMNFTETSEGRVPAVDADGNKLPWVHVKKGEKSFPVFVTSYGARDDNGKKISIEDYRNLTPAEQANYKVYAYNIVHDVFNIAQTNIEEARPGLYAKLQKQFLPSAEPVNSDNFEFVAFDQMAADGKWICPIKMKRQDRAYFSPAKNEIILPKKSQFIDSQSFYSTAFHECIHSTGIDAHLKRLKPDATFGSPEYAREELVAELGAALTAHRYGFASHIKEESAAYIKSWLQSLKEEPSFIKTTLLDVKRATSMLTQCLDALGAEASETDITEAA